MHLHVPEVLEDRLEALDILRGVRELVLDGEEIQEGADVCWGTRVITFCNFGLYDGVEGVDVEPRRSLDEGEKFHIPCLVLEEKLQAREQELEVVLRFVEGDYYVSKIC